MEDKIEEKQEKESGEVELQEGAVDLYERQLNLFRHLIEEDWENAIDICGLWQLHSLSPDEKMRLFEKFQYEACQDVDFYNLGLRSVYEEDYKQAERHFKRSLEENPDFNEAIYNLALTYEHLGNFEKAIDLWQLYQERIGSRHSDYSSVRSHIRTLKKKVE